MIDKPTLKEHSLGLDYSFKMYHQHSFNLHVLCLLGNMA